MLKASGARVGERAAWHGQCAAAAKLMGTRATRIPTPNNGEHGLPSMLMTARCRSGSVSPLNTPRTAAA